MTGQRSAMTPTAEYLSTNLAQAQTELRLKVLDQDRAAVRHARGDIGWLDFVEAKLSLRRAQEIRDRWLNAFTAHTLGHAHMTDDCPGCVAR